MPIASINQINVYYEVAGSGEPLLFIHGLGSSTRDWAPQVEAFSDRFHCVTYDVRGHGRSDKPPGPYSVSHFAADAVGLLDHLELGEAHLIGVSMGGLIAFQMAVDSPARVKSMVIINSGPEISMRTFKEKRLMWQRLFLFRLLGMERIGQTLGGRLFPGQDQAEMRAQFVTRWAENDKRAYLEATRACAGWSVMEHITSIETPTMVIASDQDYTPVAAKESYVRQMPNAKLVVIDEARHAVSFAQPEKVNPVIAAFLEKGS